MVDPLLLDSQPSTPVSPPDPLPGRLVVLTGPSGVGKGTLVKALRQRYPNLYFSVSVTTRAPRPGEQEGINYFFRTQKEFIAMQQSGQLLEWAEYANHFYGTPVEAVKQQMESGKDVLLEIELEGARQVAQNWPHAIRIFIQPPSMDELERRLRMRAQDSESSIQRRLAKAETELGAIQEFDYIVTNDDLDNALGELEEILYRSHPAALPASCS